MVCLLTPEESRIVLFQPISGWSLESGSPTVHCSLIAEVVDQTAYDIGQRLGFYMAYSSGLNLIKEMAEYSSKSIIEQHPGVSWSKPLDTCNVKNI